MAWIAHAAATDTSNCTTSTTTNMTTAVTSSVTSSTSASASAPVSTGGSTDGSFTLLLFAAASTYTGTDTLTLPAPMTLKELFDYLEGRYPGIKKKVLRGAAVTVNLEYVEFEVDERGDVAGAGSGAGFAGREGRGEGERQGEGKEGEVVIRRGDEVGIIPPVSSG